MFSWIKNNKPPKGVLEMQKWPAQPRADLDNDRRWVSMFVDSTAYEELDYTKP
jgi:hypothetical protein